MMGIGENKKKRQSAWDCRSLRTSYGNSILTIGCKYMLIHCYSKLFYTKGYFFVWMQKNGLAQNFFSVRLVRGSFDF